MSNADLTLWCQCGMPERDGRPLFLMRWDIGNNEWRFTGDPSEFLAQHAGWLGDCHITFHVQEEFREEGEG